MVVVQFATVTKVTFQFIYLFMYSNISGNGRKPLKYYVIVRPLSTVEYTSVASLFHCRQWSD